jgi:hypothetical protein
LQLWLPLSFSSRGGDDFVDSMIGHVWQAVQNLPEILVRIEFLSAAGFDHGVNIGAALAAVSFIENLYDNCSRLLNQKSTKTS